MIAVTLALAVGRAGIIFTDERYASKNHYPNLMDILTSLNTANHANEY